MSTLTTNLATKDLRAPGFVAKWRMRALVIGVIGAVLAIIAWVVAPEQFYRGYLMGFMWCLGAALGSMALVMLGHLTGGNWFLLGRRIMEAATRTLPLLAILFIPIVIGMKHLYVWAVPEIVKGDHILEMKQVYLNSTGFILRAVIYFAIWIFWMWRLNAGSLEQDTNESPTVWQRLKAWSAPGILVYALTITLASVDWCMSLDPHWFSTIYGFLFIAGQLLTTFAFTLVILVALSGSAPMSEVLFKDRLHDFGKLTFALTMVWAYFNFSQWLIIWSGNLPEEITWYLDRIRGGWQVIALALVIMQFALPFILLLSRDIKRDAKKLVPVALLVLFMRLVDLFWLIVPNPLPSHHGAHAESAEHIRQIVELHPHWAHIVVPIGVIGIWFAFFAWNLTQRPLMVRNDPQLPRLWEHSHGH